MKKQRGFTLAELLLYMTIVGTLTICFGAYYVSEKTYEGADNTKVVVESLFDAMASYYYDRSYALNQSNTSDCSNFNVNLNDLITTGLVTASELQIASYESISVRYVLISTPSGIQRVKGSEIILQYPTAAKATTFSLFLHPHSVNGNTITFYRSITGKGSKGGYGMLNRNNNGCWQLPDNL